jgi:hypothetical protein
MAAKMVDLKFDVISSSHDSTPKGRFVFFSRESKKKLRKITSFVIVFSHETPKNTVTVGEK